MRRPLRASSAVSRAPSPEIRARVTGLEASAFPFAGSAAASGAVTRRRRRACLERLHLLLEALNRRLLRVELRLLSSDLLGEASHLLRARSGRGLGGSRSRGWSGGR